MVDVERYVPFLKKHKLTQNQFLFLLLVHQKKWKLIEEYKAMFPTDDGSMIGKAMREDLYNRGFFEKDDPKSEKADNYKISKKFSRIFADKFEVGNELWDLYPRALLSEGKDYPLKLMDKNEFRNIYYERINGSYDEHLEVIKDLEYAIEHRMLKGKIENFVKSEAWADIRKERLSIIDKTLTIDNDDF